MSPSPPASRSPAQPSPGRGASNWASSTASRRRGGRLVTDAVVLATGYRERPVDLLLAALDPYVVRDGAGRPQVDAAQRLVLAPEIAGSVFVQNAERHTHGVGTPDLGLAAWRSAVIVNALTGKEFYPLPERTAFTTFGLGARDRDDRDTASRPAGERR